MKVKLTQQEQRLLATENILFDSTQDYTKDAALDILEQVRAVEVEYSQGDDTKLKQQYNLYAALGDKLFNMIPED